MAPRTAAVLAELLRERNALLPAADLAKLRSGLLALVDDLDELTGKEARALRDFLATP